MRFKNEQSDLKLYAVAGTQTVLLSFDIDLNKLGSNFIGFSVERKNENGKIDYINGTKHFDSLADNPDLKKRKWALVQTFYWQDYTVDPGKTYTYTIKPMFGTALEHTPRFTNSFEVTTEKLHDGKHSVFFNYGVTGSQAYANHSEFGNKKVMSLSGRARTHALAFLGRDLWNEGLLKFVRQAKDSSYAIYGAFYEFQYEDFLTEMAAAKRRGADIQLVVSGKADQYNDKTNKDGSISLKNKGMIHKTGLDSCIKTLRKKPSQPHNKFMILLKNGNPEQVWTGSTNITLPGIFGQCNTGHWVVDPNLAAAYLKYWKGLIGDPPMLKQAGISIDIQADTNLVNLTDGTYTFFSPRDLPVHNGVTPPQLQNYADLIDNASEMVCMIFPFNMDAVFATVFSELKPYLRYLIFESASDAAAVQSTDPQLKITAGAVYDGNEKNWAKEITSKAVAGAGILYVHNKFFIVDPLTQQPVIVTGSANFSKNSICNNDENSLLIKGNLRVADIYLSEFDRLFVHFWPRYLHSTQDKNEKKPIGFSKPLDESYKWYQVYFDSSSYQFKRKKLFNGMYGAKES